MGDRALRIMISSDQKELADLRASLADALTTMGHEPILFEKWGAAQATPEQASHDMVAECDFYVGIFDSEFSAATHDEYKFAMERQKRIRLYFRRRPTKAMAPLLAAFLDEVKDTEKYDTFDTPVDLTVKLGTAVSQGIATELRKWPANVAEILSRIRDETSQSFGGLRLQGQAKDGRLPLQVAGVLRYSERVLVALDGPSLTSIRRGMSFQIHAVVHGKSVQLGRIRVGDLTLELHPLCEILPETASATFWSDLRNSLQEEVLTEFPTEHFITFDAPDRYLEPELHLQLFLDGIGEKIKGGVV